MTEEENLRFSRIIQGLYYCLLLAHLEDGEKLHPYWNEVLVLLQKLDRKALYPEIAPALTKASELKDQITHIMKFYEVNSKYMAQSSWDSTQSALDNLEGVTRALKEVFNYEYF